jgi:hypothetical protein
MLRWLLHCVVLAMLALSLGGCASSGGASDSEQDKPWDRPPGWVPFSA